MPGARAVGVPVYIRPRASSDFRHRRSPVPSLGFRSPWVVKDIALLFRFLHPLPLSVSSKPTETLRLSAAVKAPATRSHFRRGIQHSVFTALFMCVFADLVLLRRRFVAVALPHLRGGQSSPVETQAMSSGGVEQIQLLKGKEDNYDGVMVNMDEPMDPEDFVAALRASISQWRQKGKKGVWIKLPIGLSNLVDPAVKEGFQYHHAEPDYLMLVYWIPTDIPSTIPANASHRVGIGAFVMNKERKVLVVLENSGKFKGKGMWKLPTGVVDEGEDICTAAIREVREETGVDTEFVEILAFRQSHKSFFTKSDLFFVCMLQPKSSHIEKQDVEIEAAKWMSIDEFAEQRSVKENQQFDIVAKICVERSNQQTAGFTPKIVTTGSGKRSYVYRPKSN